MVCGRPSSDSRKSSRVRSRTISPFLPYTLASTLTTLTSVENVTSCVARATAPEANSPAAESSRRRREGRDLPDAAVPRVIGLDGSLTRLPLDVARGPVGSDSGEPRDDSPGPPTTAGAHDGGAQPGVVLHLLQVATLLGCLLGVQDSGGGAFLFVRPTGAAWNRLQDLGQRAQLRIRGGTLRGQREVADAELVPGAGLGPRSLEDQVGSGNPLQGAMGTAVVTRPLDTALFAGDQRRGHGINGAKAQFAVEPEGAGIDRLRILQADLVRIDGEAIDAEHRSEEHTSELQSLTNLV